MGAAHHHRVGLGTNGYVARAVEPVMDDQRAVVKVEGHALVDVGDPDSDFRRKRFEVLLLGRAVLDVGLDQAAEHRRKRARLAVRVDDRPAFRFRLYFSSGHSTGTRVVHSVISCEAFV